MKRSWLRPRNVLLALVAALVTWFGWAVTWALMAEPNPTTDYRAQIVALSAAAQPPGEDGWPYLAEAAGIVNRLLYAWSDDVNFEAVYVSGGSPAQQTAVRAALEDLEAQGAFRLLAAAGACPRAVRQWDPGDQTLLLTASVPDVGPLAYLGKACAASMTRLWPLREGTLSGRYPLSTVPW